ncbi:hypothetical protein, partial [Aliikangiella maris]
STINSQACNSLDAYKKIVFPSGKTKLSGKASVRPQLTHTTNYGQPASDAHCNVNSQTSFNF